MTYVIDQDECNQCGLCRHACKQEAISVAPDVDHIKKEHWIDPSECEECGDCEEVCPLGAIKEET